MSKTTFTTKTELSEKVCNQQKKNEKNLGKENWYYNCKIKRKIDQKR